MITEKQITLSDIWNDHLNTTLFGLLNAGMQAHNDFRTHDELQRIMDLCYEAGRKSNVDLLQKENRALRDLLGIGDYVPH
jgi:hypothetical protein